MTYGASFKCNSNDNNNDDKEGAGRTETIPGNPSYKATMRLHITNVQKSDYGSYKCVAKNPRGEMDGTIKLYMSSPPTTIPPPTTTTLATTTTTTMHELDMDFNGIEPTSSIIVIDKLGIKYQSNLNEIDKSEQKLMGGGDTPKGYDWSKDKQSAASTLQRQQLQLLLHLQQQQQYHVKYVYTAFILLLRFIWLKFWNLKET